MILFASSGAGSMITDIENWQRAKLKNTDDVTLKVSDIIEKIQIEGDDAVDYFSEKFDQTKAKTIILKPFEEYGLAPEVADSIKLAAQRIEKFAQFQNQNFNSSSFEDEYGEFGQIVSPIERIAAYIPGGRFPLISTALMTLIPAKVAGSVVRVACSPSINPALLAAASLAGATRFLQIGGVQAIAAMAFGYDDIQPADLIVGPGNIWVNEAKKQLQSRVKIDGLAGPSELLAICDGEQPIEWLALDALAQAEHDPLACSIIISDDKLWLAKMADYLQSQEQFAEMIANQQIELLSGKSVEELLNFSETYAPEHLMLCHKDINQCSLNNYGSLFVGANSAVALGDYITGPNHTLPTLGYARQTGGLGVSTFLRIKTLQTINEKGRKELSTGAMPLAKAEGLESHYQSLKIRADG